MTPPCCMCGAPVTTMGWSVCDKCHEEGVQALRSKQKVQQIGTRCPHARTKALKMCSQAVAKKAVRT